MTEGKKKEQMDEYRRESDDLFLRLERKVDRIYDMLVGDGNSTIGIFTRMDRLEQVEETRKVHRGVLYIAVVGLIIKDIWHWFVGR